MDPLSFGSSYSVKNVIENFQDFIIYILYFFVQESKKSQSLLKLLIYVPHALDCTQQLIVVFKYLNW